MFQRGIIGNLWMRASYAALVLARHFIPLHPPSSLQRGSQQQAQKSKLPSQGWPQTREICTGFTVIYSVVNLI